MREELDHHVELSRGRLSQLVLVYLPESDVSLIVYQDVRDVDIGMSEWMSGVQTAYLDLSFDSCFSFGILDFLWKTSISVRARRLWRTSTTDLSSSDLPPSELLSIACPP